MKKFSLIIALLCLVAMGAFAQQKAKYVFYFIGDGMGINQVLGTEMYRSEQQGNIGVMQMQFTQFPYSTFATTFSATNGVTDSAASGTALATGTKTKNGAIGVEKDLTTPVNSVAVWAKDAGYRVGIASSVSVDHATPSAFYAHQGSRNSYYNIGKDLYTAGFDFYAGSDFLEPNGNDGSLYDMAAEYGYTIARGYRDYQKKSKKADKMILFQTEEASKRDRTAIPYAIDREKNDLTLEDITRSAINFLSKGEDKGFFLMVEGGKIDWACHSNDGATVFNEVMNFDNAIKVAYEFYAQHPDETLIVVTADHETGGMALGNNQPLHLERLAYQQCSSDTLSARLTALCQQYADQLTWKQVKAFLAENTGLFDELSVTDEEEKTLQTAYENMMRQQESLKTLYADINALAAKAKEMVNHKAGLGWTTHSHTATAVPIFAVGVGAERFTGWMDNSDIAPRIYQATR